MPEFGTWILVHVFTALLPPLNDVDDRDYYDVLGVPRDATSEQIRKAYKVQSLKLHPDKVAQRRETNADHAAKQYELVQEAYGVLINEKKRQRYHALQCSPKRLRFVNQGALMNPGALYENLTNAGMVDKTRLLLFCTCIVVILFVQPILIATKINHIVEEDGGALESANWIVLLIPTWIFGALWILFYVLLLALAPTEAEITLYFLYLVECILFYTSAILLALKWDNSLTNSYAQVFAPMYVAMSLRWISKALLLLTIRRDVDRMVTVEYLEKEVLHGKSLEDMSEEEQANLQKTYLVVTVPPDFEPPELENPPPGDDGTPVNPDELLEAQKVEASPEYEAAMDIYFATLGGLVGSLVFGLTFLIVLTLKLDRKIDASYWTVFIPIWIHLGSRWTYYCFLCACGTVSGDSIIMEIKQHTGEEKTNDGDEEQGVAPINGDATSTLVDRPEDSMFVNPTSSLRNFNEKVSAAEDSLTTPTQASGDTPSEAKMEEPQHPPSEDCKENPTLAEADPEAEEKGHDKNDVADEKIDGSDDPNIHIDEETFHAWQNAYEEAERGAMEQQAKASAECCTLSVQLMVIIMIVAKIDQSYWDSDDPSDPGFNTFWILFPFFLFFGMVLCCCACLIYGAEPGKAADLHDHADGQNVAQEEEVDEAAVELPPPPKEEVKHEPAVEPPKQTEVVVEEEEAFNDAEPGNQAGPAADTFEIDDLD